ncbi:hypothetical protein VI08_09020 [Luteibacter yeojuensis]|uniref:Uncharacterized protein n=1 Tax=Luteibacter yeojuensis TaxID=345309 RepID=A0A0F3KTY6_9GAMM|nr:hypothetical protein VI08_09020 [Luteibacter yeojuensis]
MAGYSGEHAGFEYEGSWALMTGGGCVWSATLYQGGNAVGRIGGEAPPPSGFAVDAHIAVQTATEDAISIWRDETSGVG